MLYVYFAVSHRQKERVSVSLSRTFYNNNWYHYRKLDLLIFSVLLLWLTWLYRIPISTGNTWCYITVERITTVSSYHHHGIFYQSGGVSLCYLVAWNARRRFRSIRVMFRQYDIDVICHAWMCAAESRLVILNKFSAATNMLLLKFC